jgi:hypothetical protein
MAEKRPQTFANHGRSDPLYPFFALPIFGLSVISLRVQDRGFVWRNGYGWLLFSPSRCGRAFRVNENSTHWIAVCLRRGTVRAVRAGTQ